MVNGDLLHDVISSNLIVSLLNFYDLNKIRRETDKLISLDDYTRRPTTSTRERNGSDHTSSRPITASRTPQRPWSRAKPCQQQENPQVKFRGRTHGMAKLWARCRCRLFFEHTLEPSNDRCDVRTASLGSRNTLANMALPEGTGLLGPKNKNFPVLRVPSCCYSLGGLFTDGIVCIAACEAPNYILLTTPEETAQGLDSGKANCEATDAIFAKRRGPVKML